MDRQTAVNGYIAHAPGYVHNDGPKLITSRFVHDDSFTLARYESTGGYEGLRAALEMTPAAVHDEVRAATLLGRGGAGFPAGVKWGFLPPGKHPYYLVVNGDESEPGTYKDRLLMERDPHQLIEGCLIACYALGLQQCFLYVRGEMAVAQERIAAALNEAYAAGYVGREICGTDFSVDIVMAWGAGAYIVGEETALIESLEGRRGMPRLKPPYFPAAVGLYGQPTIVNNVETLANLPWMMVNGSDAYRQYGSESSPGTRMFAVSGHLRRPGVYEVEHGVTTFRELIYGDNFCQGIRDGHELKMFIPGGGSAPWFFAEHLDLPLEARPVGAAGSMLGSGAIVIMDDTTDAVKAAWRVVKFFARESCGKCTPCREGTTWLEQILRRILDGEGRPSDIDLLLDIGDNISPGPYPVAAHNGQEAVPFPPRQTTICPLGPSAVAPVVSTIRRFRHEYEVQDHPPRPHPHRGGCRRSQPVTAIEPETTVEITVDGAAVEARPGELLIEACERNGTYIPRFCYHSRMSPVGMCRMCLVEVDTGRGFALQPSCMVPVSEGMKVSTESEVTKKAQDGVLEFLLINHPLDCPVCDKGGECPLQDQTMAYGPGETRFVEEKRHFAKPIAISETVYLDRERCILCDRCTRFADEVAGDALIHFMGRGNHTEVNTYPDEPFASYFSGNTVQICPVGALTAAPYRFKARPWDLSETVSTAWVDSVGARVAVQASRNRVLRVLGADADAVNWGWLSDKERFGFEALNSEERLPAPVMRDADGGSEWRESGWGEALDRVAGSLREASPECVAVLGGARLTSEAQYVWAKLAKGVIGTDNVDAQLGDGLDPAVVLGLPRATIDEACRPGGTVVLIGPDPKEELGTLYLRLRHAVVNDGVKLIEITPGSTGLSHLAQHRLRPRPGTTAQLVSALVAAAAGDEFGAGGTVVDRSELEAAAQCLADADDGVTAVLGRASLAEGAEVVEAAAMELSALPSVRFLPALRRGNVMGALEAGLAPELLPGRVRLDGVEDEGSLVEAWPRFPAAAGLDAAGILRAAARGDIDVLVLVGADPLNDFIDRDLAYRGLRGAGLVVAVDLFMNDSATLAADIVLPAAGPTECDGTFTNLEGRISLMSRKVTPPGTSRPDWMIAADLAERIEPGSFERPRLARGHPD